MMSGSTTLRHLDIEILCTLRTHQYCGIWKIQININTSILSSTNGCVVRLIALPAMTSHVPISSWCYESKLVTFDCVDSLYFGFQPPATTGRTLRLPVQRPGWRTWKLSWTPKMPCCHQLCLRREAWKSPWLTCRNKCRRYSSVLPSSPPLPLGCFVSIAFLIHVSVIPAGCRSCTSQETARGWDAASCWFGKSLPEPDRGDGF